MKSVDIAEQLKRAAELIAGADALVIAAGAGMGIDSGLPDFRGDGGFWKAYPALAEAKIDFMAIANPRAFEDTPSLAPRLLKALKTIFIYFHAHYISVR